MGMLIIIDSSEIKDDSTNKYDLVYNLLSGICSVSQFIRVHSYLLISIVIYIIYRMEFF